MIDDDELPILTQVLRTGSGQRPSPDRGDAIDARVEPSLQRALVIGSAPEDDDLPPSYRADPHGGDVFLRSAPTQDASADALDEPHLLADSFFDEEPDVFTTVAPVTPDSFIQRPLIAHAEVDPGFAARIRDEVLDGLSARIDTEFDARIAQTLHAGLETALAQLQVSLRAELAEALRDVVGRAVDDAIRRARPASHDAGR